MKTAVTQYMSSPVRTVRANEKLSVAYESVITHRISGLPVVDEGGAVVGMITRTELLKVGRVQTHAKAGERPPLLLFPDLDVSETMSTEVEAIEGDASMEDAAVRMVERRLQRLVVLGTKREPVGILSAKDMLSAVSDAKMTAPIHRLMTDSVQTLPNWSPLSFATDRLAKTNQSEIVIADDEGWPLGVFTQREALLSRDCPEELHVEEVMSCAVLCLNKDTSLRRAAAQAYATAARRIVAVADGKAVGVLTGLDFARALVGDTQR